MGDGVKDGILRLIEAERIRDDNELMERINSDYFDGDLPALVPEVYARDIKPQAVRLLLEGEDSWAYASEVFDAEGNKLGEGYWKPTPVPLSEMNTDEIFERIGDECSYSTDRAEIRKAVSSQVSKRELEALYLYTEGSEPGELSVAKQRSVIVNALAAWYAEGDEEEGAEEGGDEEEE